VTGTPILFDYIRDTELLTDAWCESVVAAIQNAANAHFTPAYGIALDCKFIPPSAAWRQNSIQVWWQDHSPDAGDLGFHTDDGMPKAYVFVADCKTDGLDPAVTTAHETWEAAVDPDINKTVTVGDSVYAYEVADAPEDDSFAFEVDGLNGQKHLISAFVLPSWFDPNGTAPFAYPLTVPITAPLTLATGGYIGVRQLPDGQWTQRTASAETFTSPRQIKRATSRTVRRFSAP
jgi:hypothetical protein